MSANDNPGDTVQGLSPAQAIETLDKMIGQLELVRDHFSEQKDVSASTKAKTLADMNEQHEAMKMGKAAIESVLILDNVSRGLGKSQ